MAASRNLTNKTVHIHDKDGNVHLIPPGSPFPEWATPQTKPPQTLVTTYKNRPLDPDLDADALARANAGKPMDPRTSPREITVTGMAGFATPTRLDNPTPQPPNCPRTYEEALAALKAKYRIGEPPESPGDRTLSEQVSAESSIFDSQLWGPAEAAAERRRQAEAASCKAIDE